MGRSCWKLKNFSNSIVRNAVFVTKINRMDEFYKKYTNRFKYYKLMVQRFKRRINYVITDRSSVIPNLYLNKNVQIHKGTNFRKLFISKTIIGYKFGEFSFTKKPFKFPIKLKKRKRNYIRR